MRTTGKPTVLSLFLMTANKIGGGEMFARELSRQLGEHGWDSALCFNEEPTGAVRRFLELPNVSFFHLPARSRQVVHPGDLWHCLRNVRPQILHLYFTGVLNVLPWASYCSGVKKIFHTDQTSRAFGLHPSPSALKVLAARAITWPVTAQVVASKYVERCCRTERYVSPGKLVLVYNAVDSTRVVASDGREFRNRLGISADRFLVLQVSNLIPEKGCHVLIEAMRLALPANPNLHVAFAGVGPERAHLEELARSSGVAEHVSFASRCEDTFTEGVFAAGDVLCQPSIWEEAFGFTLTEAMAHGKPVIATEVGGIPEIVQHNVTGLLVERNNATALAEAILRLAGDPELCHRMGRAGASAVRERFELRDRVADVLRSYGIAEDTAVDQEKAADQTMAQSAR